VGSIRAASIPFAVAAVCAAASCGLALASCRKPPEPESTGTLPVRAVAAVKGELPDEVSAFGSLSYAKKVDVAASSDATVASLPFREGAKIKAGAVAAKLRNPHAELAAARSESAVNQARAAVDLARARLREGAFSAEARILGLRKSEADLQQAKRELAESERKLADQEKLFAAGGVAEEAMRDGRFSLASSRYKVEQMERSLVIERIGLRDEDLTAAGYPRPRTDAERLSALVDLATATLRAEVSAAEAQLDAASKEAESARLALSDLTISAPVSGVVGARYVEEGERVKGEDKILTIIDSADLYAVFPVREAEALRLSRGMAAVVRVDGANAEYRGTVDLVSPTADAQSGSFSVRVSLRDAAGRLKPGMFARVTVRAGAPRKAVLVPDSALFDRKSGAEGEEAKVFEISGGAVRERRVAIGEQTSQGRVVRSGLEAGTAVVDRPDPSLREGDRVSVSK